MERGNPMGIRTAVLLEEDGTSLSSRGVSLTVGLVLTHGVQDNRTRYLLSRIRFVTEIANVFWLAFEIV